MSADYWTSFNGTSGQSVGDRGTPLEGSDKRAPTADRRLAQTGRLKRRRIEIEKNKQTNYTTLHIHVYSLPKLTWLWFTFRVPKFTHLHTQTGINICILVSFIYIKYHLLYIINCNITITTYIILIIICTITKYSLCVGYIVSKKKKKVLSTIVRLMYGSRTLYPVVLHM